MHRLVILWVGLLVVAPAVAFGGNNPFEGTPQLRAEPIDSLAEANVRRYASELNIYRVSADAGEWWFLQLIVDRSSSGSFVLENTCTLRLLERKRADELNSAIGGAASLADRELFLIAAQEYDNLRFIDSTVILGISATAGKLTQPAAAQAARDLLNAWKDLRESLLRKLPFLTQLIESGVMEKKAQ